MKYLELSLSEIYYHETFAVDLINSDNNNYVGNQFKNMERHVYGLSAHSHIYFFTKNNILLRLDISCTDCKMSPALPV